MRLMSFVMVGAALLLAQVNVCQGAIVSTLLTLDAPSAAANEIGLQFNAGVNVGTPATSELTGTIDAEIDIDLVTGVISSIELTGGNMVSSGWTVTGLPLIGSVTTTDAPAIAGTDTPEPTEPADLYTAVTAGEFVAAGHFIRLTGGSANGGAVGLEDTDIEGSGTGTLTSNLVGGFHEIVFSMDIDDVEPFPTDDMGGTINLLITGTIVGRAQITAIPEPSGLAAWLAVGGLVALRRRRQ